MRRTLLAGCVAAAALSGLVVLLLGGVSSEGQGAALAALDPVPAVSSAATSPWLQATNWCTGGVCEKWVTRYNGPASLGDEASSMALDGDGNVYVTGRSGGSGSETDYATIKYNAAGSQQWATRYNGPANSYDEAWAVAVDGAGNVYVTGWSMGVGSFFDYATIKYNSAGIEQWVARYNGPHPTTPLDEAYDVAVDGLGNVYVTGRSTGDGSGGDYATIKYNSAGAEQWVRRYNGPGNSEDGATSIALDSGGNVYVTGRSTSSVNGTDYATIKYNSAGTQQWVRRYNGPGNSDDDAWAIAVDASANVYVTGRSTGSGSGTDYATVKYNSAGTEQWARRYNGPDNSDDDAWAIAVDASGNVYVTGRSTAPGSGSDYATIKYNSAGIELWAARYDGPANLEDGANSIALDGNSNVYVTGGSQRSASATDYVTIKYDSDSAELWVARYNGPANSDDEAWAVAVNGTGSVVHVTGESVGSGSGTDYATIAYLPDSDGDGFSDAAETYLGTDPNDACPDNTSDPAWPLDQNNDGFILAVGDVSMYAGKVFTQVTCPSADPNCRLDLDTNGTILIVGDVTKYAGRLFESCT